MKELMRQPAERSKELFELAESQQGFFTAKQAESVGYIKTNHSYHVKSGNWLREARGIYRLAQFPTTPDQQKILYALWSQNRQGQVQGVYSHETALAHYGISDANPSKLDMTVPKSFRRTAKIPKVIRLHHADLTKDMILESRGFLVTKPNRTISDIMTCGWVPFEIVRQASIEALKLGLLQKWEIESIVDHVIAPSEMRVQLQTLLKEIRK
ncbi:MAG: hypothetical protein KF767_12875 [Bdellovibrionaceae bacterium]|nr:hypothetical protein [Pseudobdellovibrionaceae bacterium]